MTTNNTETAVVPGNREARAVPAALRAMLNGRPELAGKFQHFQNAFHDEGLLDEKLLEMCRARIDTVHDNQATTTLDAHTQNLIREGRFASFSEVEQNALAVAEQIAIDAHGITDQQVSELVVLLGEPATVSLITAASMHDATTRLQLVLRNLTTTA